MASQDFLQMRNLAAGEKMVHVADDEPVVLRIKDVAGGTSTPTVVLSDTSSTLTVTDSGANATALDLSAAAYNTVGEVADAINATAGFECKVLDALRSDASNNMWPDGAVSSSTKEGQTVFDITSDTSELAAYRLRCTYDRSVGSTALHKGHRITLKEFVYNLDLTAAAGAVKIYETSTNGTTETQIFSLLSVDTTDTTIDLGNGITPGEGNDLIIAVDGTVIDANANFLRAQYKRE